MASTGSAQVDVAKKHAEGDDRAGSTEASPTENAPSAPGDQGSQGDVVETIAPSDDVNKPSSPTRLPKGDASAARSDRTQVEGWARESLEYTLSSPGYRLAGPSGLDVPHDRVISRTQMFVRASYVRAAWFEATVSGFFGYSLREQGPADTSAFDGFNGQATSGDVEPDLRELYFGFYSKRVDFRVGQQRVAWGRADLQSPNDVVNARDLRDAILTETELRHIPTPLLRLDVDFGPVSVELVGTPVFVPDAYDLYGTNWSPVQEDSSPLVKEQFASIWAQLDPSKQGQFNALTHDTALPASNWTAPSGGTKVSTSLGGVDLDAYYHYGFDTTPYVAYGPSFAALLGAPFTATYLRRHHVGFDAATTAGPLALRLDAAYDSDRAYYHVAFTSFSSATASGVASVEYQTGDLDKLVLLEATYNHIFEQPDAQLLGYDRNSFAVLGTFRWPIGGGVAIDLREVVGIEPVSFVLEPAFRWKMNDAVLFKAGAVLLGGEEGSFGWYYRHNTSAFAQAKYSF